MSKKRTVEECQKILSFLHPSQVIVFIGYLGENESDWQIEYEKNKPNSVFIHELNQVGWKIYDAKALCAWSIQKYDTTYKTFTNPITFENLRACYEKLHEFKMPVNYEEAFDAILEKI